MVEANHIKADSKKILKKSGEDGVDRISELPDEIIVYILSLLPLREAVSTSVLSPRWYDLWTHIPKLDLNTRLLRLALQHMIARLWDPEKCRYIEMVNSVLRLHKAPFLKEFKISLLVTRAAQSTVTKWLDFVFSRQVESLELNFECNEGIFMVDLDESLRGSMACRDQALPVFKSLKRLRLQRFRVSGEALNLFLRNCPLLERLSIEGAHLTSDVVVCGTTLGLKRLDIDNCSGENSIKVSAPNLTRLCFGPIPDNFLIENVPKLIGADFTCRGLNLDEVEQFASAAFRCISQLKLLKLHIPFLKIFLSNLFPFPRMPNLEKLVFACRGAYGHGLLPLTNLIWASPRLQEFRLEFLSTPRDPFSWREGLTDVERRPHQHLKVFEFLGFCRRARDHMELVTYISNNCVALEKIILKFSPIPFDFEPYPSPETLAARARVKKKLHGIVPDHIQLCIL